MTASVLRISRDDFVKIREKNRGVFDIYTVHKLIYSLFPKEDDKERDFLFADKGGDFYEKRYLILSKTEPAQSEFGSLERRQIPEAFLARNHYAFEVLVNPVKRDSRTGKIIPVKGRAELARWFTEKSPSYGFEILPDSLVVSDTDVLKFSKKGQDVVLGKAKFTGKLKVTDRQLFIKSFESGIGRGKAFGFGLLQIAPLATETE